MRFNIIWTIYRKELMDSLRDRLTLLVLLGLPLLLYPMLIIGVSRLVDTQVMEQQERASKIALWGEAPQALLDLLRSKTNTIALEAWQGAPAAVRQEFEAGKAHPLPPVARTNVSTRGVKKHFQEMEAEIEPENPLLQAAREIITRREVDAVLVVWPGFSNALSQGALGQASIYYDSVRLGSEAAQQRLWNELTAFRQQQLKAREQAHGLAEGFTRAVQVMPRNVAVQTRRGGQMIGSVLPMLLIIMSAVGALNAAIDLTAGEKDRNTMQTLLCAPLHATEIVTGKFFAVWSISLVAALANTASLAATFSTLARGTGLATVPFSTHALTFLMLLPVTFIITAVFIAVAALARDAKDAGNFLGPALMLLMGPLAAGMTPGIELNAWTSFVPLLNVTLLIKSMYLSELKPDLMFLTVLSSLIYAALALLLAARVFGREQVLVGGKDSVRALFKIERARDTLPTPAFALTAFAVVLVISFYGTLALKNVDLLPTVLIVQYGFFLLPVLALAVGMKFSLRQTFSLRIPDWRAVVGAVLMGLSAWAVIGGLVIRLLPPPDSLIKALEKILLLDGKAIPLWAVWLILGITPALCEESLFRGLILSGLRRLGKWPAIVISALLFGVAHASIYRLLPTLFLGILMGYVVWRSGSIFCSMIFHVFNNGFVATLVHLQPKMSSLDVQQTTFVPWPWTLAGVAVLLLGLFLLRSAPMPEKDG